MKNQPNRISLEMLTKQEIKETFYSHFQVYEFLDVSAFCFKQINLVVINLDVFLALNKVSQLFVLEHELAHLMYPAEYEESQIDSIALQNMLLSGDRIEEIEMEKILTKDTFFSKSQRILNFKHHIEGHGKSKHETHC